jgi:hypothetical protein
MTTILSMILVALVGVVSAYFAPPLGYILDLSTAEVLIATVLGVGVGSFVLVYAGAWLTDKAIARYYRLRKKEVPEHKDPPEWLVAIAERYGAPGLGVIGPFTIGGMASALLGPAIGIPKRKLAPWLAISSAVLFGLYTLLVAWAVTEG